MSIPFFDPAREAFLEYDIAKLLYELNQTNKPSIGVISSLPVAGNPVLGQPAWTVMQQLDQLFDVKMLDATTLQHIDESIKVLLLIHPKTAVDSMRNMRSSSTSCVVATWRCSSIRMRSSIPRRYAADSATVPGPQLEPAAAVRGLGRAVRPAQGGA